MKSVEAKVIEEDTGEIPLEELESEGLKKLTNNTRVPELDEEGHSIVSQSFIKTRYRMTPWDRELVY